MENFRNFPGHSSYCSERSKFTCIAPYFFSHLRTEIIRETRDLQTFFLQAQRDYFGAHTYELLRDPGKFIHTNWTGLGGSVSSTTYDA